MTGVVNETMIKQSTHVHTPLVPQVNWVIAAGGSDTVQREALHIDGVTIVRLD